MRLKWLVADPDRTLGQIADDLTPTVPDLFVAQGVVATGPYRWSSEADDDGQLWVVLDVAVRPWTDPVRDRARRATTPKEIR